jgi:RNA polymerase sigma-70 factor (ECF subfamily)
MQGDAALGDDAWMRGFHDGVPGAVEDAYRQHFPEVLSTVRRLLSGADAETVTHEVFCRLLANEDLRRNFQGGSLRAWLVRVATNAALDHLRRRRFERQGESESCEGLASGPEPERAQASCAEAVEAKVLIERFRRDHLPPEWSGVFDARFLRQLPQRDAAAELGIRRTTLVYQEHRIRALLRAFLLEGDEP